MGKMRILTSYSFPIVGELFIYGSSTVGCILVSCALAANSVLVTMSLISSLPVAVLGRCFSVTWVFSNLFNVYHSALLYGSGRLREGNLARFSQALIYLLGICLRDHLGGRYSRGAYCIFPELLVRMHRHVSISCARSRLVPRRAHHKLMVALARGNQQLGLGAARQWIGGWVAQC